MKQKIQNKIDTLKEEIAVNNDAISQTHAVADLVIKAVQATFTKVQTTQSIDDRISALIEGLQGVVKIVEDKHNILEATIDKLRLQVDTLEALFEGDSEESIPEHSEDESLEETSVDEDGEKKSES